MTVKELESKTIKELVEIYNANVEDGRQLKSFRTKVIGAQRVARLLAEKKHAELSKTASVGLSSKRAGSSPRLKTAAMDLILAHSSLVNADFAKLKTFKEYCKMAETEPTRRQASKFRRGKGLAYEAV